MGLPAAPFIAWPQAASWYLLGRHALAALLQFLPQDPRRLWLPSYFCFDVADYWRSFIEVASYSDDPRHAEPDWSTLCPSAADIVVAVNFFGVRSGDAWRIWRERNPCVLVEDHSHDPASGWALRSHAEYAFASLRKTLPVPDGAILWSPKGLLLPANGVSESPASMLKLAAMLWKREYLDGCSSPDTKSVYRTWQQAGEQAFGESQVSFATVLSQDYLRYGLPAEWRNRRVANARRFLAELRRTSEFRPIFSAWPEDAAPLGVTIEFDLPARREATRQRLQEQRVYCSVHWPAPAGCDPAACDLAGRLLTIPTDQRYSSLDMEKIAAFMVK